MEGYHSMDRMLLQHMLRVGNDKIPFPSVAGYAGTAHLYKVGFKCVSIIRTFSFSELLLAEGLEIPLIWYILRVSCISIIEGPHTTNFIPNRKTVYFEV